MQVSVLLNPTLRQVGEQILVWQPNIVYFSGEAYRLPAGGKLSALSWRNAEEQGVLYSSANCKASSTGL